MIGQDPHTHFDGLRERKCLLLIEVAEFATLCWELDAEPAAERRPAGERKGIFSAHTRANNWAPARCLPIDLIRIFGHRNFLPGILSAGSHTHDSPTMDGAPGMMASLNAGPTFTPTRAVGGWWQRSVLLEQCWGLVEAPEPPDMGQSSRASQT